VQVAEIVRLFNQSMSKMQKLNCKELFAACAEPNSGERGVSAEAERRRFAGAETGSFRHFGRLVQALARNAIWCGRPRSIPAGLNSPLRRITRFA
jgi:hypothetical protein